MSEPGSVLSVSLLAQFANLLDEIGGGDVFMFVWVGSRRHGARAGQRGGRTIIRETIASFGTGLGPLSVGYLAWAVGLLDMSRAGQSATVNAWLMRAGATRWLGREHSVFSPRFRSEMKRR